MDNAFRVTKSERYVRNASTPLRTKNINVENLEEQGNNYWMAFPDMIANKICNA